MYDPEKSLGKIRQLRHVYPTPINWRLCYIGDYIESGTCGYVKVDLMQLHYNYPHYYLLMEQNQDDMRGGGKRLPLETTVGLPMYLMSGILLKPTLVLSQEQT